MMATGEKINIEISGPAPYGFRLYGGDGDPFVVAKLRPKSKAQKAGVVEGDIIVGINGQTCQNISHAVAMGLLEKTTGTLHLTIIRGGSKDRQAISTAYVTIGSQLRPVSPNVLAEITNQTQSTCLPTYLTGSLQELVPESKPEVTYRKDVKTLSEGDTTRKITTESKTEQRGGTTVKQLTTHETSETSWKELPRDYQVNQATPTVHVSNVAGAVWIPSSSSQGRPVTLAVDLLPAEPQKGVVRPTTFFTNVSSKPTATTYSETGFRVSKTPAKPWVWEPSHKPVMPKRALSPGFQLDTPDIPVERIIESPPRSKRNQSDLPDHLLRILTEESSDFDMARRKKKIFADSSFYDDPKHRYPTIEEQIKMARKVAMSLTAPVNVTARGQRMFMKRKEKAGKWAIDYPGGERHFSQETENELYYNPTPWKSAKVEPEPGEILRPWEKQESFHDRNKVEIYAEPTLSASNMFAQKLANYEDKCEQIKQSNRSAKGSLAPQMCFNLAKDLRKEKGKGGSMFAQRAARINGFEEGTLPNTEFMRKMNDDYEPTPEQTHNVHNEEDEFVQPSPGRLKELIELTKAQMSPWDAAAEYGSTDNAFQHLNRTYPKQQFYTDKKLAGSITSGKTVDFTGKSRSGYRPVTFSAPRSLPEVGGTYMFSPPQNIPGECAGFSEF